MRIDMLKIRDDVELEDLEKFGFTVVDDDYIWLEEQENIAIDRYKRTIHMFSNYEDEFYNLEVIYDLIKAGLVVKE